MAYTRTYKCWLYHPGRVMVGHSFNVWPMKKGGGELDTVVGGPSFLARKNDPVLFVPLGPRQFLFCLPNFLVFLALKQVHFRYNISFKDDREEEEK